MFGQFFNDDFVESATGRSAMARGASGFLVLAFLILSGLTTFMFYETYVSSLGAWAGPAAGIVAGLVGLICMDIGALLWAYVRSNAATSGAQMAIALTAAIVDLILALMASALYVILSTTLASGIYTSGGALTDFGQTVNLAGIAAVVLSLTVNFACVFAWQVTSAATRQAQDATELQAMQAAARAQLAKMHATAAIKSTAQAIAAQVPTIADNLAKHNQAAYVANARPREYVAGDDPGTSIEMGELVDFLVSERLKELAGTPGTVYENGREPNTARPT